MSMEALKLFEEPTPEPKKSDEPKSLSAIRRELVIDYYETYLNEMGEKCTETFVKCLGSLRSIFEGEDEGELIICYPTREEWNEELRKFFYKSKENWYRANNRMTFYTFCKNYGRYNHHLPKKQEVPLKTTGQVKQTRVMFYCSDCKKNHYSDEICQLA